ncbi:MAG: CsgG/HfaB family protein, partial [Fidelibacterota bacterium]
MNKPWAKPISAVLSWTVFLFSLPVHLHGQEDPARVRQTTEGGATVEQTLPGEGHLTVAVLDMEGRGISALEAQTLTDRMRSELVSTGAVTVVERGQMQEVLEEQGFQQTGCTSAECAVEVGKLLGVSQMMTGSIGKIGQSYTIDVRMFSVETGAITKSVNRTYRGEVDGLIVEIERLAWDIVAMAPPPGRFPAEEAAVLAAS